MTEGAGSSSCCDAAAYAEEADWPADVSRLLFQRLDELGFAGRSVLEVGCGWGRLLVGALVAGASSATGVDLDDEALDVVAEHAEEAGVRDACSLLKGDGAEVELEPHDMVILDRVICCYQDADRLIGRTASAAGEIWAMTVPESRGLLGVWNRVTYGIGGLLDRLRRLEGVYLHDVSRLERRLAEAGFQPQQTDRLGKWHVGIYRRAVARPLAQLA